MIQSGAGLLSVASDSSEKNVCTRGEPPSHVSPIVAPVRPGCQTLTVLPPDSVW
jgi:hypothetical protein